MKLKDGVKCGLGFAIGWWIWNDVIRFNMEQLVIAYWQSDLWKEAWEDMPKWYKETFPYAKPPQNTKTKK